MLFPTVTIIAALLSTASAVNIRAWQGTGGCYYGSNGYYTNVASYTCIAFSNSYGVDFTSVPSGAQGQVYYDSGCSNFAQAGGSGTYCLSIHNNMKSANWFYPYKKFAIRAPEPTEEMYTGFTYTTPEGDKKHVLCSASEFEKLFDLYNAEDWAALAEYPEDVNAPEGV